MWLAPLEMCNPASLFQNFGPQGTHGKVLINKWKLKFKPAREWLPSLLTLTDGRREDNKKNPRKTDDATYSPCTYMTMHSERATSPRIPSHLMLPSWVQALRKQQVLNRQWWWWSPSFIYSNLLAESLYDTKIKPLIKSLPPSVSVNYGLGTFLEYKGCHCNLFLRAGLKNQIELHRLGMWRLLPSGDKKEFNKN